MNVTTRYFPCGEGAAVVRQISSASTMQNDCFTLCKAVRATCGTVTIGNPYGDGDQYPRVEFSNHTWAECIASKIYPLIAAFYMKRNREDNNNIENPPGSHNRSRPHRIIVLLENDNIKAVCFIEQHRPGVYDDAFAVFNSDDGTWDILNCSIAHGENLNLERDRLMIETVGRLKESANADVHEWPFHCHKKLTKATKNQSAFLLLQQWLPKQVAAAVPLAILIGMGPDYFKNHDIANFKSHLITAAATLGNHPSDYFKLFYPSNYKRLLPKYWTSHENVVHNLTIAIPTFILCLRNVTFGTMQSKKLPHNIIRHIADLAACRYYYCDSIKDAVSESAGHAKVTDPYTKRQSKVEKCLDIMHGMRQKAYEGAERDKEAIESIENAILALQDKIDASRRKIADLGKKIEGIKGKPPVLKKHRALAEEIRELATQAEKEMPLEYAKQALETRIQLSKQYPLLQLPTKKPQEIELYQISCNDDALAEAIVDRHHIMDGIVDDELEALVISTL